MFAGGHEDLDWTMSNLFDAMGAMSSKYNDRAAVASRAYDVNRDGFVIAGGAGVLVLEELEHAKARGAKIYAETGRLRRDLGRLRHGRAVGRGRGALHAPGAGDGEGPVDYINTHGTSTPVGDSKEMGAIREVFGDKMPNITSTKSLTGHSLGAAGVQESIYSILMMQGGFIGESAHIEELDPEFEGMPIVRKRIDDAKIDTVLSNSFGFGGTNATLVFQRLSAIGTPTWTD
jgi:3-oxoacyl-[acyl-carrier-protein] synthase-1